MPATIGWRNREEDGMWVVWDLPHGVEYAPQLSYELAKGVDRVEERWGELCREIGANTFCRTGGFRP